jgi:hypothetical protein
MSDKSFMNDQNTRVPINKHVHDIILDLKGFKKGEGPIDLA